jgi:alpha-mannosidase
MRPRGITLVAHTHWDREWYEPFEVFRAHLVEMLDEALADLERDPRLHFTLDGHVALVDDYLELRPENESRIRALVAAGRLYVGPWYTQADTLLTDGEALIRNLAFGIRRAEQLGGSMRVGYMPDQFGHAAQVPQLLRLFGIDGAVLWRGVGPERPPHAFRWQSPDGSAVTALWLQDGYASGRRIPSDPAGFVSAIERTLDRLGDWADMPLAIPVGDDHVRLATWLPEAAAALRERGQLDVKIGGYQHHLPQLPPLAHTIVGELRSPAFAPVLAGVASARIREKLASFRATQSLLRYAEPLAAWVAAVGGTPPSHLIERAWKLLLLNQAHDSAAGCGADAAHDDVQARYRWAEQLATVARDQALAQLRVDTSDASPHVFAFTPVQRDGAFIVEAEIPKSVEGWAVAVGPDGIARPIQPLSAVDERPVFEGEFSAAELGQYLGGLDPATPIFGKFLTGLTARDEGGGVVRLDVGLGEAPAPPRRLADDQKKIRELVATTERFKVVLHAAEPTKRVLVQAGPAREGSIVPISIRLGTAEEQRSWARRMDDVEAGIASGPISVVAQPDGSVVIRDATLPLAPVRANDLVDEGDRGDLYHFDSVGEPVRAVSSKATVIESGPVRARLRIVQELELPRAIAVDRKQRSVDHKLLVVATEVTLHAGERRIEFASTLTNEHLDHRLRALVHVPRPAERLDADHGLAVIPRPFDTAMALGGGTERAAPTGQHHHFVDVGDGALGVALLGRGLPEHEVIRAGGETQLALTLLRSVGWLSRGDLSVIDHAAGPMVPTPGAQELGPHRFEYALVLHAGDWRAGGVLGEARRYAAPPIAVTPKGTRPLPPSALVEVAPSTAIVTATHPAAHGGLVVRLLNTAASASEITLRPAIPIREAIAIDPLEAPASEPRVTLADGVARLTLRPWQLATVLLQ